MFPPVKSWRHNALPRTRRSSAMTPSPWPAPVRLHRLHGTQPTCIILGGGLVGLALAAALDASGLTRDHRRSRRSRRRALDAGYRRPRHRARLLVEADVRRGRDQRPFPRAGLPDPADRGRRRACAGRADVSIRGPTTSRSGWMHENRHLRAALLRAGRGGQGDRAAVEASRGGRSSAATHGVTVTLDDGRNLRAPLLVAAEGRNSPTREAAGIRVARWKYDHAAIVSTLRHDAAARRCRATRFSIPAGPFALLPMNDDAGGHRSAIVWSVAAGRRAGAAVAERCRLRRRGRGGDGRVPRADRDRSRRARPIRSASTMPRRSPASGWRWSAMPRTASTRSPARGSTSAIRDAAALAQVLVEGARLGLDLGDRAVARPLPALARARHLHGRRRDRQR